MHRLDEKEMRLVKGNEAITLASMMTFLAIGLVSVICYKFFTTNTGKAVLPGGFTFSWN